MSKQLAHLGKSDHHASPPLLAAYTVRGRTHRLPASDAARSAGLPLAHPASTARSPVLAMLRRCGRRDLTSNAVLGFFRAPGVLSLLSRLSCFSRLFASFVLFAPFRVLRAYPFSAPAVMPLMNCSDRNRYSTSTGSDETMTPAASMPTSKYASPMKNMTANGNVRAFCWVTKVTA